MTDNVVNHAFDNPMTQQRGQQRLNTYPLQAHPTIQQQREVNGRQDGKPYLPYSQADALLGELLREVLEMRQQVVAVHDAMADLTEALREQPQPGLPVTALRHGAPR